MIDVERSDGFKTVIGGKMNQDFNIQGRTPPHLVDTDIIGRFFVTSSTTGNGGVCNLFTFTRTARYVVFQMALMSEVYNSETSAILTQSGADSVWLASVYTLNNTEEIKTFYVDLGVPDGSVYALKLWLLSYQTNSKAYCRVVRAYQTDFLPTGV
jgi:hypothetical protein